MFFKFDVDCLAMVHPLISIANTSTIAEHKTIMSAPNSIITRVSQDGSTNNSNADDDCWSMMAFLYHLCSHRTRCPAKAVVPIVALLLLPGAQYAEINPGQADAADLARRIA